VHRRTGGSYGRAIADRTRLSPPTEADPEPAPAPPARPAVPFAAPSPAAVLALQRSAGNRAVAAMLAREPAESGEPPGESVQEGFPVEEVGASLHERLADHEAALPRLRRTAEVTVQIERDWYAKRNVWAALVEVFNAQEETDPARWDAVLARWDEAEYALTAAFNVPISPETINEAGVRGEEALTIFDDALVRGQQEREAFARYLEAFTESAEDVHFYTTLARDIAFCMAVGAAVVTFAPVAAGAAATIGTGYFGLAAGSTSLAAFQAGATVVSMGALGAGIEGSVQALSELSVQAGDALADLLAGSDKAVDNFDFAAVAAAGGEGFVRGFADGVLSLAGVQAERVLASHASAAVHAWLGPGSCNLWSLMLRRSLTRATTGGASGAVLGALEAGYRAALEGKDLEGIVAAMEAGFAIGGAAGAAFGGAGGAWEARQADALRQQVADRLRAQIEEATLKLPRSLADDRVVNNTLDLLRANPEAGSNQQLIELTPEVWKALHDPDGLGYALSEVWLEEHLLSLVAPAAAADRFGDAALQLAGRRGAPVVVLKPGSNFEIDTFYSEVVVKGNRFLDLDILARNPEHGATTHLIQDLAVDRVLWKAGVSAEQYRALLAGAIAPDGRKVGNDLWIDLFDPLTENINNPDNVYRAMREVLEIP
jgi:hypothetical protein